jgi:hypothetical protein
VTAYPELPPGLELSVYEDDAGRRWVEVGYHEDGDRYALRTELLRPTDEELRGRLEALAEHPQTLEGAEAVLVDSLRWNRAWRQGTWTPEEIWE